MLLVTVSGHSDNSSLDLPALFDNPKLILFFWCANSVFQYRPKTVFSDAIVFLYIKRTDSFEQNWKDQ